MSLFSGTGRLTLLALRRDRIKLPVWIFSIVGLMAVAVPSIGEVYGQSEEALVQYAGTMSHSIVSRMLAGAIDGPQFGSVIMMEYFLFIAVLVAFMSGLAVVRHTRQNEETGRSELLGSAVVGRFAHLTAALLVAICTSAVVAALISVALIANDMPTEGSFAMALALGSIGVSFAVIAAVSAQVIGSSRGASGAVGAVIGLTFVLRGIGDALGTVAQNGLSVTSAWPVWLSPFGWGQQAHPFAETNWMVFWVFGALFMTLTALSFWLVSHRDHGMGMVAARSGRAQAKRSLLSPLGLAWRLQRTVFFSWAIGIVLLGATLGVTAIEFKDFFMENEQLSALLADMANSNGNVTDVYFAAMMGFMAFMLAGYGLQAALRLQSEESNDYLESLLSTATSRFKWALSHIIIVVGGVVILGALAGLSNGVAYALVADNVWSEVGRLTVAGLVQVPAVLVFTGFAVALFGLLPRASNPIVWGSFAACLLVAEFGALLKLPEWIQKISPFIHTPAAPANSIDVLPIFIMSLVALALTLIGLMAFRRRDIVTS